MFTIPEDLNVFSLEGLSDLRRVAFEELTSLRAANTPETISDDDLARGEALAQFVTAADTRITELRGRADRFNALPTAPETTPEPAPEPETPPEPAPVTADVEDPEPAPGTDDNPPAPPGSRVSVADMAPHSDPPEVPAAPAFENHTIVAAADIPGIVTGSELNSWREVADAFCARTRSYSGKTPTHHTVAEIRREFGPEFTFTRADTDREQIMQRLNFVADETRLDGGSLVAANGWCAPSMPLYTTCNQVSTDGLYSAPEVTAPRGGIIHNQGIEFDSIFGDGTGFGNLFTEDDIISGVEKECIEIPCPPFVDDRLKVAALCLTGSILQNRAYPEFVTEFVQGAIAVFAHVVNRQIIADVVAGSTAVDLSSGLPWNSDTSVVSQTLSAVEHAIVDIKYRLRLPRTASLEVVLPYWVLAQYRADWIRRNGVENVDLADSQLRAWFSTRGANPQYVYDWQDAFSGVAGGYGADTAVQNVPSEVEFLVYPAGTWVVARLDVIRLDSIYDSVNLPQNMVTQLFQEDGFRAMRMCPLSRVYTVPICPSGATSALQEVCELVS